MIKRIGAAVTTLILIGCAQPAVLPQAIPTSLPITPTVALTPTATDLPTLMPPSTEIATTLPPPTGRPTWTPTPTRTRIPPSLAPTSTAVPVQPTSIPSTKIPTQQPESSAIPPTPIPPPTASPIPPPPSEPPEMIARSDWGAVEAVLNYRYHSPTRITLHEDGIYFGDNDDSKARVKTIQRFAMQTRGWNDIPYHYLIDRDGVIYEGRPPETIGDTATNYDSEGHVSVTLLGDYNTQQVTDSQIESAIQMVAWLSHTYDVPVENIGGHRDYAATTCPGKIFYHDYFESGMLVNLVQGRLATLP